MKPILFIVMSLFGCNSNAGTTDMSNNLQKVNLSKVEENKGDVRSEPKKVEVHYTLSFRLDDKLKNFPEETQKLIREKMGPNQTYVLRSSANQSVYTLGSDVKMKDEVSEKTEGNKTTKVIGKFEVAYSNYYKDFDNSKLTDQRFLKGEVYLIDENLQHFDWKIENESFEISGYKCKVATATNNGYPVKAWFTEDIAIPNGPAIYHGLPGLILKVETPDREIYASKVSYPDGLEITRLTEGKKTSKADMDKILGELRNRQSYDTKEGNRSESRRIIRSN